MEWWGFSKAERGAILSIVLILLVFNVVREMGLFVPEVQTSDFSEFYMLSERLDSLKKAELNHASMEVQVSSVHTNDVMKSKYACKVNRNLTITERLLINHATEDELVNIGMDRALAARLIKYRFVVSGFRNVEDLEKVYGLSKEFLAELEPWLDFRDTASVRSVDDKVQTASFEAEANEQWELEVVDTVLDINSAAYGDLLTLYGIGDYFAKRILEYRNELGGYVLTEQLLEIYGMDSSRFRGFEKRIQVGMSEVRQLGINGLSINELASHPYISYKQALHLVRFREQHGPFRSADDFLKIHTLDSQWVSRIKPYVSFN